ncbi:hypothetical protein [Shewanella morhuae]|uniref:hypothetical protein n=1 Tax=Shewanella morhuae TaxID=365591 RepID=UPI001C7DBE5B|nr:hypothetical protein [Shewanella morhuae]
MAKITVSSTAIGTTMLILTNRLAKQDNCIVCCAALIGIVFPVTRRKYIHIGSTATSMSPTVTDATMRILINPYAARLAKKYRLYLCSIL